MSIRQRDTTLDPKTPQKWQITIDRGFNSKGKRIRIFSAFWGTEKQAKKEETRLSMEAEAGTLTQAFKMKFDHYLDYWLEKHKPKISPKTYSSYKEIIELHIKPQLGNFTLQKLKPHHIQDYCDRLLTEGRKDGKPGGLAPTSIIKHHRIIHKALGYAVTKEMVLRNASEGVELPPKTKPEYTILTLEQINQMLDTAFNKDSKYFRILFIAINTGLRRGEILGLREMDIDEINSKLFIRQTVQYTKDEGVFFKSPKTQKSYRKVDVTEEELKILKLQIADQKQRMSKYKDLDEEYYDHNLIFSQDDGKPMHPDTLSSWFPEFMVENLLPKIRFHDLRHNHISHIIEYGISIAAASDRAGHNEQSTTQNTYTHAIQSAQREAAYAMGNLLKMARNKS